MREESTESMNWFCYQVLSVPGVFLGLVGIMTKKLEKKLSFQTVAVALIKHRSQLLLVH